MKYITLAALFGAANACHMGDPLMGMLKQGPNCPKTDAKKLNHVEAHRELFK
jgi:hypothetical protein